LRPNCLLDLAVVGSLLHLLPKEPYSTLQKWVSLDLLVASFLEDVEGSLSFLTLPDDSERGRRYLLAEIGKRGASPALLLALLLHTGGADTVELLLSLTSAEAGNLFAELHTVSGRAGMHMSDTKMQRIAEVLGTKLAAAPLLPLLRRWLAHPAPEEFSLGLRILGILARVVRMDVLWPATKALPVEELRKFLRVIAWCAGFPHGKEMELALGLADHAEAEVREWAQARCPTAAVKESRPKPPPPDKQLTKAEARAITSADPVDLDRTVDCCIAQPRAGLCAALAARTAPPVPNVSVCVALIGAFDPLERFAEQLARFGSDNGAFLQQLEEGAVQHWGPVNKLPMQGHAWLYRWDPHCFAFADQLDAWPGGFVAGLRATAALASPLLRQRFAEALALLLGIWRWRDRPRFAAICTGELAAWLVERLPTDCGEPAARSLMVLHDSGTVPHLLAPLKAEVTRRLPELTGEVRRLLRWWIDSRGLASGPAQRVQASGPEPDLKDVRRSTDLDRLAEWCRTQRPPVAEAAALRLLDFGEAGAARLVGVLRLEPPGLALIAGTVILWPEGAALEAVRALARDAAADPEVRFRVGVSLFERGEKAFLETALDAVCAPAVRQWFRADDWKALGTLCLDEKTRAIRLAVSAQPLAYTPAVEWLTAQKAPSVDVTTALVAFLECGTERLRELRLRAAGWMHGYGMIVGFHLLLENVGTPEGRNMLLVCVPADHVTLATSSILTAGLRTVTEKRLFELLQEPYVDAQCRADAFALMLADGTSDPIRQEVLRELPHSSARGRKLQNVAEVFTWGLLVGRELTGRLFTIEMLAGADLGYTRLEQNKIFINVLPMLRGEEDGRDVVQGLILHEFGHHVYHRGEEAQKVWKQGETEGLFSLLNLVSDEHLERNLRAGARAHGDLLKRLDAYAFQHSAREMPVRELLDSLQGQAFEVLTGARLGAARKRGCVAVESGGLLLALEKGGHSFARFMRALRMGLGNRHGDPLVGEGLDLFKGRFRQSTMPEMLALARRLREIFGWQANLLSALGQDASLGADGSELLRVGEGMTNDEVREAMRRLLDRRKDPDAKGPPARVINVSPDEEFTPITTVQRVPFDAAKHAAYAKQVARHARQMRRYFDELGIALEPQRFRTRGKRLDPTRVRDVVLRGDPRMLLAREPRIRTDLFLGVVIDCSGSMQVKQNIEKAKLFGTLVAEAARSCRGIDLRVFGFTDRVIYDAGDALRCAVHSLEAGGGNNDAAALWHAALTARASRRRAKLLVMISDGLPTECSVAALRALVSRLTNRWKMCCAQVAVQALEEICFPHYVLLDEADPDASVRRFGAIVMKLVQRVLRAV
jgi:hypothetical protein